MRTLLPNYAFQATGLAKQKGLDGKETHMKLSILILPILLIAGCVVVPVDGRGKAGGDSAVVCHKGKKTLELPRDAVQAHLDHGDRLGPC